MSCDDHRSQHQVQLASALAAKVQQQLRVRRRDGVRGRNLANAFVVDVVPVQHVGATFIQASERSTDSKTRWNSVELLFRSDVTPTTKIERKRHLMTVVPVVVAARVTHRGNE